MNNNRISALEIRREAHRAFRKDIKGNISLNVIPILLRFLAVYFGTKIYTTWMANLNVNLADPSQASQRLSEISASMAKLAIKERKPDLILLDCNMPKVSGPEFMEQLRADDATKDIPIIFLTSRDDAATVKHVLELKPEGYILKSTPKEKMLAVIADYFKNH